jgi:hypothetical protein
MLGHGGFILGVATATVCPAEASGPRGTVEVPMKYHDVYVCGVVSLSKLYSIKGAFLRPDGYA